ncbi:MAG: hypothetical protein JNM10_01160 [Planctomycetia bacterium]|nr:hypothetical protein [Planctomycetia bacterium]
MSRRRRLPRVGGACALLAVLAAAPAGRGAAADDLQPEPPRLFFADPDERARAQIDEIIERSFGDVSKAVVGRDVLVARFGLWSVSPLVLRVRAGTNETIVRNSILTLGALRRTYGPSRFLWPAVPALTEVLKREGSDPWRRAFAALALGTFYGPETARRGPGSREGTRAGAETATADLLEGNAALLKAVGDANGLVSAAASLALGKIGGMGVWGARAAQRRTVPLPASPDARVADLVATGLLPGDEDKALGEALRSEDRRVRAAAALAIACWAVAEGKASPSGALAADAAARARALDALLRPERNTLLRDLRDGAEAIFARAALALVADRVETFAEIYEVAVRAGDDEIALACAQGLLFAPRQSPVRKKLVDLLGRDGAGRVYKESVIAAALMVAGTDGTDEGVEACRDYLKDRGKLPHGRVEWDVRFHGALGLVRALLAGRVSPAARPLAAQALVEAARAGLIDDPKREGRTFRDAVREVGRPFQAALATNPEAGPDPGLCARLEAAFEDPLALTARDPVDVAVDRLNDQLHALYGLDALPKAAAGGPGSRTPSTADQELRFLLGWLERYPYFTRLDLQRDRGRTEAPVRGRAGDDVFDVEVPR